MFAGVHFALFYTRDRHPRAFFAQPHHGSPKFQVFEPIRNQIDYFHALEFHRTTSDTPVLAVGRFYALRKTAHLWPEAQAFIPPLDLEDNFPCRWKELS